MPSAARHVVGRALKARTYALFSKRLLFLTFSLVFGRDSYSSNNWGALDSGGLNSNYRMSEDQKEKNTFEFRERIKAVKTLIQIIIMHFSISNKQFLLREMHVRHDFSPRTFLN